MNNLKLPDEITKAGVETPRDLTIISIPKAGKSTLFGKFTEQYNALVLDLERGGYDYINARKLSTYNTENTSRWESFQNYIAYRNLLLENKGKYQYLIIDGLSDLDDLSDIGGTLAYMTTLQGKSFNRDAYGAKYEVENPNWRSVVTIPNGYGYQHTRQWFMKQIDIFKEIAPYRIYGAHLSDKYIKDRDKEEVIGTEIALTGQLKRIFASRVTSLAKLVVDENERYLSFEVQNDSIIAGSRAPFLKGKILISSENTDGEIVTFWDNIYKS